jgi:hypothetical protein
MRNRITLLGAALVAACGQNGQGRNDQNAATQNPAPETPVTPSAASENAGNSVSLPDDRTPLEEPKGPIDPKSAVAAGQVVQHYGALIEQGRWTESWKLWSNPEAARAFDRDWRDDSEVHMEIGKPGDMEGAAGSSYVTVPAVFYGKTKSGGSFRRGADVILRRVNDVPGSTEAQRRWHIERVELKPAG